VQLLSAHNFYWQQGRSIFTNDVRTEKHQVGKRAALFLRHAGSFKMWSEYVVKRDVQARDQMQAASTTKDEFKRYGNALP
jgi:hypothetical protein